MIVAGGGGMCDKNDMLSLQDWFIDVALTARLLDGLLTP
ncbi:hypothetical protein BV133_2249 [Blastochloris viridis]|uniref:Uncharacterized protein n=1 Tax=Blastochloris viridis TaxID=1079 RepID=A0A182D513_BLAVI|nr:hypothetical protein BV133_2249 [Blastochloris viridis]